MRLQLAVLAVFALLPGVAVAQGGCKSPVDAASLVTPGVLTGAINPTSAPLQYIDDTGKLVGLDVDFGDLIAARLCLKMQFQPTEFVVMIPGLRSGRFDMIDTFMYYTPERAAVVHMIPYGAATLAIVVPKDATNVSKLDDLAGKRFGTQLGSVDDTTAKTASEALVRAGKAAIDIRTFPNYADLLQALSAGQLDGALIGTEQAYYYQGKGVDFFRIAASGLFPHAEALAFKDEKLGQQVAETLNAMKADGAFDALFARYHHCTLPPPYRITTGPIPVPVCAPAKG